MSVVGVWDLWQYDAYVMQPVLVREASHTALGTWNVVTFIPRQAKLIGVEWAKLQPWEASDKMFAKVYFRVRS